MLKKLKLIPVVLIASTLPFLFGCNNTSNITDETTAIVESIPAAPNDYSVSFSYPEALKPALQKMFATNLGTEALVDSIVSPSDKNPSDNDTYFTGLRSWSTTVQYDDVKITDNLTGEVLYENDFSEENIFPL